MVIGRRMTIDISPATLDRRNDFRAISRLRRSVIDGMYNSMNQNHASTRRKAGIIAAA